MKIYHIEANYDNHPEYTNNGAINQCYINGCYNEIEDEKTGLPEENYEKAKKPNTNIVNPSDLSIAVDPETKKDAPVDRGQWGSKAEFVLSCVGLSVGIGNVWRFPYLAYQNGGGAFLFPYFILLILVGKPMYFMEVALGQFSSLGPMSVWRCFPIAKGVGAAMVVISILVSIYYNVIMCYTLFYMGQSFRSAVPWSGCFDWWGADNATCYVRSSELLRCSEVEKQLNTSVWNETSYAFNSSSTFRNISRDLCTNATQTSTEHFWERYVLDKSSGIWEMGSIKWDLTLCLLVSWMIIFLCLMKGVKSSGKVVYFTATFPYVILIILFIFGLTLDGAIDGIKYFFIPEWEKLKDITVWRKAAEQLFFSLSVSWGGLIMFGSYNKFNNKVHRDAMFVSSLDFVTSLIAGVVIFSVLGSMAKGMNMDIKDVAVGGQGLAFVAYPEALARMVVPQLWSVLFFIMLFLLGLDSEFALLETFLTALYDEFPKTRSKKVTITFITCATCFLLGLPCVTQGGQYVLNLMDTYGGGYGVIFIAICELVALMWGYGAQRFCADLEYMLGFRPGLFWRICWMFISPVVLMVIFVYSLYQHTPISVQNPKEYPEWSDGIGWCLALVSMIQIPIWALVVLYQNRSNWRSVFRPAKSWGPADEEIRILYEKEISNRASMSMKDMSTGNGIDNLAADLYNS